MGTKEEEPLKIEKEVENIKKKTFKERLVYFKENITLEPALVCYVIPGALSRLAISNLNLEKACRVNLGFSHDVCDSLIKKTGDGLYQKEELQVQELISSLEIWKNILMSGLPTLLILFLGAWSDRTGKRKICMIVPIVGELVLCFSNILNAFFIDVLPVEVNMFAEAFFPSITGSWVATYLGVFSYITSVSDEETMTFRVGVANLCLTAGNPIGSALSGVILEYTGYYGVFSACAASYLFSLVYLMLYVHDPVLMSNEDKGVAKKENKGVLHFLKTFFDLRHARDSLSVAFKKGPNKRRTKSILVIVSIALIYGASLGEYTIRYLFTRYRFNWDAVKFSFYNTYFICTHFLGAIISISIFSKKLNCDDAVLGFISNISHVIGALLIGFAANDFEMYVAITVETFNATSFTALRSIYSKLCTSDELAKSISVFNLAEIMTALVFGPLYSWIYMLTVSFDAGFVFYVSAAMSIPAVLIFVWFYMENRTFLKKKRDIDLKMEQIPETEEKVEKV